MVQLSELDSLKGGITWISGTGSEFFRSVWSEKSRNKIFCLCPDLRVSWQPVIQVPLF